jgi:hypothetical protein
MPYASILFGALLIALGVWGYVQSLADKPSITALIPAFVGALLLVAGLVALKESLLKHAMHLAATVGLLGFLAGVGNIVRILVTPDKSLTGAPGISTLAMTALCAVFVGLCINSFVQARRRRAAREAAGQASPVS